MASDEIPVGSKWVGTSGYDFMKGRPFTIVGRSEWDPEKIHYTYDDGFSSETHFARSPSDFKRLATRIDQPKAEDPVPVGSRWRCLLPTARECKDCVVTDFHNGFVFWRWADDDDRGFRCERDLFLGSHTRIDTPSPPITDPFERAVVGALSRRVKEEAKPELHGCCSVDGCAYAVVGNGPWVYARKCEACFKTGNLSYPNYAPPKCAPTCGPRQPCRVTVACRDRDDREWRAWVKTVNTGTVADPAPRKFAPPAPSPVGLGSLVGVYRVNVERKRVR